MVRSPENSGFIKEAERYWDGFTVPGDERGGTRGSAGFTALGSHVGFTAPCGGRGSVGLTAPGCISGGVRGGADFTVAGGAGFTLLGGMGAVRVSPCRAA